MDQKVQRSDIALRMALKLAVQEGRLHVSQCQIFFFLFFLIIDNTCTWWVLNSQSSESTLYPGLTRERGFI